MSTGAVLPGGDGAEMYRSTEIDQNTIDYYVDGVNGSDSNNGTSPITPFATLAKARTTVAALTGQKQIYVFAATYSEDLNLSSDLIVDAFDMVWYLETGAIINTTQTIISTPAQHFFGAPLLQILGNGEINYTGTGELIDTSDAFFSILIIQAFRFTYLASATGTEPIVLGEASDSQLTIDLKDKGADEGEFGWRSASVLSATDYLINCKDPQFSKFSDDITILGGKTQTFSGRLYNCPVSTMSIVNFTFESKGNQDAGNAEGIRSESPINFLCGKQGGLTQNYSLRALSSGSNVVRIFNQKDLNRVFASQIEVAGGELRIENSDWSNTSAGNIGNYGITKTVIKNSIFSGTASDLMQLLTSDSVDLYDVTLITTGANALQIRDGNIRIIQGRFKASTRSIEYVGLLTPKAIDIHDSIANVAAVSITDTLGGLSVNSAWDDLI